MALAVASLPNLYGNHSNPSRQSRIILNFVWSFVLVSVKPLQLLTCNLCGKIVGSSDDLVLHYAQHFAPNDCRQCNGQIISIGERLFHLILVADCTENEQLCVKFEPQPPLLPPVSIENRPEIIKVEVAEDAFDAENDNDFFDNAENFDWVDHAHAVPSFVIQDVKPSHASSTAEPPSLDDFTWPAYPDESEPEAEIKVVPNAKKRRIRQRKWPEGVKRIKRRVRTYECYICGKSTGGSRENLVYHIQKHYGEAPPCPTCKQVFSTAITLRAHVQSMHKDVKDFICSYCGKGFSRQRGLTNHITIHTGEKRHKCPDCGKAFASQANMHQHRRVHTGAKPCKCYIEGCDRAYMFKVDLKRHLYGAHGIFTKKFECKACGKVLPENKLLVAHMKTHLPSDY